MTTTEVTTSPTALLRELQTSVVGFLRATGALAAAEGRLAASSAVTMLLLVLLAGAAALVGWLLIVAAAAYGAWLLGIPLWGVCVGLAFVHAGATIGLWRAALHLGRNLEFRHTRGVLARSWSFDPVPTDG